MNIDSNDYRCPDLNVAESHSIDAILDQIQKTNSKTITDDASFKNWREDKLRYRNKLLNKLLKAYSDYKTESYREMKHHRNVEQLQTLGGLNLNKQITLQPIPKWLFR